MEIQFVNTTLRDGSQSLWASGLRTGVINAVAEDIDRAGFSCSEVPVVGLYMKKFVRDLKEDPWAMARLVAKKMPNSVKSCMCGARMDPFEAPPPREIFELFYRLLADMGALNRAQLIANTHDQRKDDFPWQLPMFKRLGLQNVLALSFSISPRHTDDYYEKTTRELVALEPDAIYLKDQGGLLTVDRIRTLLPAILRNIGDVPLELHSHCTTGLAPLVYLEALKLGIRTLHVAIPPLANGSGQPSVLNVMTNAAMMGYTSRVDLNVVRSISERLMAIARQDGLPIGAPLEYDVAQYIHQVPGGVISNLRHNLGELRIQHRLQEVLDESVQVRKDFGYPVMITPHSQFVATQAALNVAMGERYKVVIDEFILFAAGVYGEDSGYAYMEQNLKDKLLSSPRAKELASRPKRDDISLKDVRARLNAMSLSDEDFLLRYIMKGESEIAAMRAAGPPKQYFSTSMPLLTLMQELERHKSVRYVHMQRANDALLVEGRVG